MTQNDFFTNSVKGISKLLNDYLPSIFPNDALTCSDFTVRDDDYFPLFWNLKFMLGGRLLELNNIKGIGINSVDGMINPFEKCEQTPLVLIEKKSRFLEDLKKNKKDIDEEKKSQSETEFDEADEFTDASQEEVSEDSVKTNEGKYINLEDFHVIRGADLAKALSIIEFICSSFFEYDYDNKPQLKNRKYILKSSEIEDIFNLPSLKIRAESILNHTFRLSEIYPVILETTYNEGNISVEGIRSIKCPGYIPVQTGNDLYLESEKRKIIYHSEVTSKQMRLPHFSHFGKIDMLESPESESIGLTLFLARGAEFNPSQLCIDCKESNASPENLLSLSTSAVPFLNYSDGPRVTMGGKNLKQAVEVDGAQIPMIKTGVEDLVDLKLGVNALVGYMLYDGVNFEDGIVISESFAKKMSVKSRRSLKSQSLIDIYSFNVKEEFEAGDYKFIYCEFKGKEDKDKDYSEKYRLCYKIRLRGSIKDGEPLVTQQMEMAIVSKGSRGRGNKARQEEWKDVSFHFQNEESVEERVLMRYHGFYPAEIKKVDISVKVLEYSPVEIQKISKKTILEKTEFSFVVEEEKPFEIGDKMTGRHGNKGTVSKIVSDDKMPKVVIDKEEKTLDCIISPMSVVSRMNIGQLLEIHSTVAYGERVVKPFGFFDQTDLLEKLREKGADEWGYFRLTDGRRIAAGYQYMVRLDHCVRDKLHVVKTANTSVINGQPLKGKRIKGGQRIGEMEFWTLFSHNAFNVIEDFAKTNLNTHDKKQKDLFDTFDKKHKKTLGILLSKAYKSYSKEYENEYELSLESGINDKNIITSFEAKKLTRKSDLSASQKEALKENRKELEKENKDFRTLLKIRNRYIFNYIKGKDGYFRQHMLGRRIHYSGRTTITPEPGLDINTVLLPVDVGIKWFEKIGNWQEDLIKLDFENAKHGDQSARELITSKLNDFIDAQSFADLKYMVLLNRQPSLHRHSIQSFYIKFWKNYSIGLPTLLCDGFGADFDGDTMAFYFPVSQFSKDENIRDDIQSELKKMLPTENPFRLGDRKFAWSTSQDFAFGHDKDKDGFENEMFELTQRENYLDDLMEYKNKILKKSCEKELSISFFDIIKDIEAENECGPFLKLFKKYKARGKDEQFNQLTKKIDIIQSGNHFGTGLDIEEYLCTKKEDSLDNEYYPIALRSRSNLMEKKLSVANAGYFTRKMVSFLYPYTVKEYDCKTEDGIILSKENYERILEMSENNFKLRRFVLGRNVKFNGNWVLVDERKLEEIENSCWENLEIRSPLKCKCKNGICAKCYGADIAKPVLSDASLPDVNSFVGVSAGHVIGEFGTQLSMKTFQTGKSFSPDKLSRLFFSRFEFDEEGKRTKKEIKDYFAYLENIANQKAGDESLFDSIGVFSIHMEILYAYMVSKAIYKEWDMKEYMKKFDKMGVLTSLSFESAKSILAGSTRIDGVYIPGIFDYVDFDQSDEIDEKFFISKKHKKDYDEVSPTTAYMFANPFLKKVLKNG